MVYKEKTIDRSTLKVGDKFETWYTGRGRGGHYRMRLVVTKVNRKTINCTECDGSYGTGTLWQLPIVTDLRSWIIEWSE